MNTSRDAVNHYRDSVSQTNISMVVMFVVVVGMLIGAFVKGYP